MQMQALTDLKESLLSAFDNGAWVGVLQVSFWSARTSALILLSSTGTIPLVAAATWIAFDSFVTLKTCQKLGDGIMLSNMIDVIVNDLIYTN